MHVTNNLPTTLAAMMIAELLDNHEDYFSFEENLIALVSLADILKLIKIYENYIYKYRIETNENINQLFISHVKLHFTPWLEIIIVTCLNATTSEDQILDYICSSNNRKLSSTLIMNEICLNIAELIYKTQNNELIPNHNITTIFYKFKEFNIILKLIIRCYDLAQSELARGFKIYRDIEKDLHPKFELIGGIIYFLVIICFETFTPGLNEFLRLSLSDLNEIIKFDPSLLFWTAELNLLHTILALHSRCDQNALDDLLKLTNFESRCLKPVFKNILTTSLAMVAFDELIISLKLIEKYGNTNIMSDFINALCIIKKPDINLEPKKIHADFNGLISFNAENELPLSDRWMRDFVNHLRESKED